MSSKASRPLLKSTRPLKRPISAYMLFRAGFVKQFRDPEETYKTACARAKQGWDSLPVSDQNIWQVRYEELMARYNTPVEAERRKQADEAKETKKRNRAQAADELEEEAKKMREETVPLRL